MRILKYRKTQRRSVKNAARHSGNAERVVMPVSKGDTVRVMRGDDKGKEGKITRVYPKTGRVVIDGVNIVKRHRKARSAEEQGGIIDFPAPIHHSNVMLLDPKSGEPTRVRARKDEAETDAKAARRAKERISVKSGDTIPRAKR
ncbi:MAG TPA: 50S ribosomal protein L24 [Usitatibacter sp.]